MFAHVVPRKGLVANHGVKQLLKDIERLGHKKLCLKSDGEPALVAIQEEVQKIRSDETLLENSPAGDSRAKSCWNSGRRRTPFADWSCGDLALRKIE